MSVLAWDESLNVGVAFMDEDHTVAARLINEMAASTGTERLGLLDHFIEHTRAHFSREEEMMRRTGFLAAICHGDEHRRVLTELDGVRQRLAAGQEQDRYFRLGLPMWLRNHRDTMDLVTAQYALHRESEPLGGKHP